MSIVPVVRVSIIGPSSEKLRLLGDLQVLGCVHLEPATAGSDRAFTDSTTSAARRALRFLAVPRRRRQAHRGAGFDAKTVELRALAIEERLRNLAEERRFLSRRIGDLAPWGDFRLPNPAERLGLRLWFYVAPHYLMGRMPRDGAPWQVVHRDNRFAYVAVLATEEPAGLPVARTHTGSVPLAMLEQRLESVEAEEDDLQAERVSLSRWFDLLGASIARLEDEAALACAAEQTRDDDALFILTGWAPSASVARLRDLAERASCALLVEPPRADLDPPTLLANTSIAASGQDLLAFYMTPGYRTWDPSAMLVGSFILFFGMILADVGYGLSLAAITALFWRTLGRTAGGSRLRALLLLLAAAAVLIGVVTGSYFGAAPLAGTAFARLHLLDSSSTVPMMELAAAVGVLHLAFANLITALRLRGPRRLAPIGWVLILLAGAALYVGSSRGIEMLDRIGYAGLALGSVAVAAFSGAGQLALGRAVEGVMALARLSAVFGDVLSYLRLFALGFAGTSLAMAFNNLAADVVGRLPGFGLLPAALILLVGHALNLVLGVASGFVHGLRLNFIEFFNWSLEAEGRPFQAFRKREARPSTR